MRWIEKTETPPAIRDYLAAQAPVGHGLDYETFASTGSPLGGTRGGQLRGELIREQHGLCAYTGAGIDQRIGDLAEPAKRLKFSPHNEHLKPQSECRRELRAAGKTCGAEVGEDLSHTNIVAALLVSGGGKARLDDLFGASYRRNQALPVWPTHPDCELRFVFDGQGRIEAAATDDDAINTIAVLNLNHETLRGWREQAITAFIEGIQSRADAGKLLEKMKTPVNGRLPEYCFAIGQVVERMLG